LKLKVIIGLREEFMLFIFWLVMRIFVLKKDFEIVLQLNLGYFVDWSNIFVEVIEKLVFELKNFDLIL